MEGKFPLVLERRGIIADISSIRLCNNFVFWLTAAALCLVGARQVTASSNNMTCLFPTTLTAYNYQHKYADVNDDKPIFTSLQAITLELFLAPRCAAIYSIQL